MKKFAMPVTVTSSRFKTLNKHQQIKHSMFTQNARPTTVSYMHHLLKSVLLQEPADNDLVLTVECEAVVESET